MPTPPPPPLTEADKYNTALRDMLIRLRTPPDAVEPTTTLKSTIDYGACVSVFLLLLEQTTQPNNLTISRMPCWTMIKRKDIYKTVRGRETTQSTLSLSLTMSEAETFMWQLACMYAACTYYGAHRETELHILEADKAGTLTGSLYSRMKNRYSPLATYYSLFTVFEAKNTDYGNAWRGAGIIGVLVRLCDKLRRIQTLLAADGAPKVSESLVDSYYDAANYAVLAAVLLSEGYLCRVGADDERPLQEQLRPLLSIPYPTHDLLR